MEYESICLKKPKDWPANEHEIRLEGLREWVEKFRDNPSHKNREILLALTNDHDLNQTVGLGLVRVSYYEVCVINELYMKGKMFHLPSLISFLYDIIAQITRIYKIRSCLPFYNNENIDTFRIEQYEKGLDYPMKLYHLVYQKYTIEKDKSFAEQLIEFIEETIKDKTTIDFITYAYSAMLLDISNMNGRKREKIWKFTRDELLRLFKLEAKLLKMNDQPANERPTKGVLMMQISNYILKSRNEYNEDYICKYLPIEVAKESITNRQIWMGKTEFLNDDREQKVIPELFKDDSWIEYDWIKDIDFSATRKYYVSCFSKSVQNAHMQNAYGGCLYGYKNDRIANLIGPVGIRKGVKKESADKNLPNDKVFPFVSQVISFDVLYDTEEAKDELKYLFNVINMFDMTDDNKKSFLQEILQYWILSVKDNKWSVERERRYVIFLYEDYTYREVELDDRFLKVKTSLFITPDFIIGNNPVKHEISRQLERKRKALYSKEYLLCKDCLMQDHDIAISNKLRKCPVCGSENVKLVSYDE